MRLCVAQLKPVAGDIEVNIQKHLALSDLAQFNGADLICFPELSLTGYEPKLAKQLALNQDDERLGTFQDLADSTSIAIAVGAPTMASDKPKISMIVFQPGEARVTYSKQQLHDDELPYFVPGEQQIFLKTTEHLIAPAICYESLQASHAKSVAEADIYIASVAKPLRGVDKAYAHYPLIARRHSMAILMANCVGLCDDFVAVGRSAVWDSHGKLPAQLDDEREGIVLLDTSTCEASTHYRAT